VVSLDDTVLKLLSIFGVLILAKENAVNQRAQSLIRLSNRELRVSRQA